MPKVRLDQHLQALGLTESRELARRLIMAGEVLVNGQIVDRPASTVQAEDEISLKARPRFASRGGEKLEAALARFRLDVAGQVCADVGASTGGFTDCLLQRGAARVYAIDVGHGLLAQRLRTDDRVVVLERTNARHLAQLPELVQFVSVDASFISLKLLLPVMRAWLLPVSPAPLGLEAGEQGNRGDIVALVKPQFEAGRKDVSRGGGVIRDPQVHRRVLLDVLSFAADQGFAVRGLMASPLRGPKGNVEFLAWLSASAGQPVEPEGLVAAALAEVSSLTASTAA